jgi:hypothetical protein
MNPRGWDHEVEQSKVDGIRHFQEMGFRVFAFVDNEPKNLKAVSRIDKEKEILLLHADTIFESKRARLPAHSAKGKLYDLTELIPERALPRHIQFVWHGINDEINLRQFLASDITWGECDVRLDPVGSELILRHDSFKDSPLEVDEEWFGLEALLDRLEERKKSIKIDLKGGGILINKILGAVESRGLDDSRLWFNGNVERVQEDGFRTLARERPNAVLQCPIDFLAPLILSTPLKAKELLDMLASWGLSRFSLNWMAHDVRPVLARIHEWEFETNIYNVPDLNAFLQAVLLLPRSITSDFNFPKWHYFGRGSGEDRDYYQYSMRKTNNKGR